MTRAGLIVGILVVSGSLVACDNSGGEKPGAPAEDSPAAGTDAKSPPAAPDQAPASAELMTQAKTMMESYIGTLDDAIGKAKGVTNELSVATATPQITALVDRIKGYADQLEQLSPETMTKLKDLYQTQLDGLKGKLDAEIERLSQNDSFKPIVEALKQIQLP